MKNVLARAIGVLLGASLLGCSSFEGEFRVENRSDKRIWVHAVESFRSLPPVGILIPDAHKGASMNERQDLPDECTIVWWYMIKEDDYELSDRTQWTTVDLSHLPKNRGLRLVLRFETDYRWTASERKAR